MLFTGLQRHTQSRLSLTVFGYANDTAGHGTLVSVFSGKKSRMGTPETHGDTKALRTAHDNIDRIGSWRFQQYQTKQISGGSDQCGLAMGNFNNSGQIMDFAGCGGILYQHGKKIMLFQLLPGIAD